MRRSTEMRLDRLADAFTPPDSGIFVQYVAFDAPPWISPIDRTWLQFVEDRINAHARELIARYGPDVERFHRYQNAALDVLDITTMERVDHLLERFEAPS